MLLYWSTVSCVMSCYIIITHVYQLYVLSIIINTIYTPIKENWNSIIYLYKNSNKNGDKNMPIKYNCLNNSNNIIKYKLYHNNK